MSYKSYKQLYRIVLNSKNADSIDVVQKLMNTAQNNVETKYFFNLNIELPFTTQARLAVKSFHSNNQYSAFNGSSPYAVGSIHSPTISQRNTYQSFGTSKGQCLLSHQFNSVLNTDYINPDYQLNSIDIQNNTSWLTDGIELVVLSKILDDVGADIEGFPEYDEWTLELIIFDAELEQNPAFHPLKPFQNGNAPTYG